MARIGRHLKKQAKAKRLVIITKNTLPTADPIRLTFLRAILLCRYNTAEQFSFRATWCHNVYFTQWEQIKGIFRNTYIVIWGVKSTDIYTQHSIVLSPEKSSRI